jgi:hypothetical protein
MATLEENRLELTRLLGRHFVERASFSKRPIPGAIGNVVEFHQKTDYAQRDYVNATLSLLVKNLREIEAHDEALLTQFRKMLRAANEDTYFGVRLEVSIAASLIRHKIAFLKSDPPDFVLTGGFNGVSIECGSAHLTGPKPTGSDLTYKIGSVIKEKSGKSYCNACTCLFIHFTNVNFHSLTNKAILTNAQLKRCVAEELACTSFGSVVLFTYLVNRDLSRYQQKYHRVDGANPSKVLLGFLNAMYPFGEDSTHDFGFLPTV